MSQIGSLKRAKQRKKKKRLIVTAILLIVLIALVIYTIFLFGNNGKKQDQINESGQISTNEETGEIQQQKTEEQQAQVLETVEKVIFPVAMENGKLEAESLFQFSGMNPDAQDSEGENIAALFVTNKSEAHLTSAQFTVVLADETKINFEVSDVPASQSVMIFSKENVSYDTAIACKYIECTAEFSTEQVTMSDRISVTVQGTSVILTNISGKELSNLIVSCHCLFEGSYFGGLTYNYPVELLPAGESVTIEAMECYMGEAAVVRIEQGS